MLKRLTLTSILSQQERKVTFCFIAARSCVMRIDGSTIQRFIASTMTKS
jgi:hypothetical protein